MTIAFARLFTTQGLLCGALNEINTYRATTLAGRQTTLVTQLVTSSVYGNLVSDAYTNRAAAVVSENSYVQSLQAMSLAALLADVNADRPGTGTDLPSAVAELRRQMLIAGESLNDCPGTVVVASVGSPTGDPSFVFGTSEPVTGKVTDYLVPDVYLIQCTADRSQSGTSYAETFSLVGKTADSLPTDATYPSGTGLDTTVTLVDPATDESIILNGGFDDWTVTNTPDNWTLGTSVVAGTHVFEKISDDPRGTAVTNISLRLVGDGTVLIKLRQTVTLLPNTAYSVQFRLKKVADPGTDWAVSLLLVDQAASPAQVTGNSSYANVITSGAATSVASNWTNVVTGVFMTPAVLPSTGLQIEIRMHQSGSLTTAAINTAECYVDHVSVVQTDPLYAGGPTLTGFSGLTESVVGDARTATVALTSGVPSTYLIRGMDRLLGLASLDNRIPTIGGGTETRGDALVV
jgi:hypothetical protein